MFPCSMVPFALGLYIVTAWCRCSSLVDYGPRDVLVINQGPEEHFLAWCELWKSTSSMGLVELCAL